MFKLRELTLSFKFYFTFNLLKNLTGALSFLYMDRKSGRLCVGLYPYGRSIKEHGHEDENEVREWIWIRK